MSRLREKYGLNKQNTPRLREKYNIANKEYQSQLKKQQELKTSIAKSFANKGVNVNVSNFNVKRQLTPVQQQSERLRNKYFKVDQNSLQKNVELEKKYRDIKKTNEYKKQEKDLIEQSNKTALAKYELDKAKVDEKDITLFDKTIGRLLNAPGQLLNRGPLIKNDEGSYQFLPSSTDLIEQKISDSYDTKIGKFLGDTASQVGKIGFSAIMNVALPGSGTTAYFGDMYVDNYNEAISEGYDDTSALLYAITGTASEYFTGKLLGSATKTLTGGKTSKLTEAFKKTTDRVLGDGRVSNFLANAGSEGVEEFIQEYIGNINKLVTLEHSTDAKEYWDVIRSNDTLQDALYAGWMGALTGGIIGGKNENVYTEFNNALEERKSTIEDAEVKKAIENVQKEVQNKIDEENSPHDLNYYEKKKNRVENIIKNSNDQTEINRMTQVNSLLDNKINELKSTEVNDNTNITNENTITNTITDNTDTKSPVTAKKSAEILKSKSINDLKDMQSMMKDFGYDTTEIDNEIKSREQSEVSQPTVMENNNIIDNKKEVDEKSAESTMKSVENNELKSMYDKLNISDKNAVDKIISLRQDLKENPNNKSNITQINNLQSGLSKDGKAYMSAYNKNQFKIKDYNKVEAKEPVVKTETDIFKEKLKSKMNIPEEKEKSDVIRVEPKKDNIIEEKPDTEVIEIKQGVSKFNERVKETEKREGSLNDNQMKEIDNVITYEIDSNKETIDRANTYISKIGFDKAKESYLNDFDNKARVTVDTIGRGQMLVKQALENGDTKTVSELLPVLSLQLTEAGKVVQAAKLYKYATPEMVVLKLQRTIDYLKRNNVKGAEDIVLTKDQINKIMSVYKDVTTTQSNSQTTTQSNSQEISNNKTFDQKELKKVSDEVMKEIASQLKGTWLDKVTNWRYFSMLSLPATHVRNILSNSVMLEGLIRMKNINARVIESAVNSISPNTFENRIKTESEIYNNDNLKAQLKSLRNDLKSNKITPENSRNIELRNKRLNIINKMKGEVQIHELHNEINNVSKENKLISKEIEKINELRMKEMTEGNYKKAELFDREIKNLKKQRDDLNTISDKAKSKLPKGISTKSFKSVSKDTTEIAKMYLLDNKEEILKGSKYKTDDNIESMKSVFGKDILNDKVMELFEKRKFKEAITMMKNELLNKGESKHAAEQISSTIGNIMETITQFNYKLLETEDGISKTLTFKRTFAEILTSNNINDKIKVIKNSAEYKKLNSLTEKDNYLYSRLKSENPELFAAASNFAIQESLEATFQQYNAVASWLNYWQHNKGGKAIRFILDATVPFTRTPVNIAKTAIEYSPIGLIKSTLGDLNKVKSGDITASQYINNIAKGLTGIQVMAVGYLLGNLGLIGGDDDDEYNLKIGDKSYSIDWLSPTSIIMMTGARGANLLDELDTKDMNGVQDSLFGMTKPFLDMSILTNMSNVFDDYKYSGFKGVVENVIINYTTQFIPTTSSALARVIDPVKRTTTPSKDSTFTFGEKLYNRLIYKIPGASKLLLAKIDELGNETVSEGNIVYRLYDSFITPYDVTDETKEKNKIPNQLNELYEYTNDSSVLPTINNGTIKYKGKTYNLSNEEKTQYQKTYGSIIKTNTDKLFESHNYYDLTDEQKVKAVNYIYQYATDKAKSDYLGDDYEYESTWNYNSNVSLHDYAIFKASIDYEDSDTKQLSAINSIKKYEGSDEEKAYLYTSVYPTTEETNNIIVNSKIPFDKYLDYKWRIKYIEADDDPNSTVEGAKISGSKKKKILKEIAKTENLTKTQKLLLTYLSGYSIKNGDYTGISKNYAREVVFDYVNKLKLSADDKRAILDKAGYTILKNGNIDW